MKELGFKVITNITRPGKILIEGLRGLSASNVGDCIGRNAALEPGISARNRAALLGPALTVRCPGRDNLMIHKAMDMAQPGDVIVVETGGSMQGALVGAIMMNYCKLQGVAGMVVDGCIRDADEIAEMDIPVYARGTSPNGVLSKSGPGEVNVPVMLGGKEICPGDILIGDADGLIVLKPQEAELAAIKAKELYKRETVILENLSKGIKMDRSWVERELQNGCEFL